MEVEEFVVQDAKFEDQENGTGGTALELVETTAQVINSTLVSNRKGSYRECAFRLYHGSCRNGFIGGAIIATSSSIGISLSKFEDNAADLGGAIFAQHH